MIYLNLGSDSIKQNCNLAYYFNKTDIKAIVVDGRNKIILSNWPDDKHIVCYVNKDIPVKLTATFMFSQQKCIVQLFNRSGK